VAITVIPAHRGRHLFEAVTDTRVQVRSALTDAVPHLIVVPCGQDRRLERLRQIRIPTDVRQSLAEGRTGLVFDASTEGVQHKPDITRAIHEAIASLGASPSKCVYVTQDRNYRDDYLAHCAVTYETPVTVLVHDYWIWDSVSHFAENGEMVYQTRLAGFRARTESRERQFVSLNRTPRPTKILFLLKLLRDGLWERGFISFGGFKAGEGPGKPRPSTEELLHGLRGFEDLVVDLVSELDRLQSVGRMLLGMEQHGWTNLELWNAGMAADLTEYGRSWFSVITETEMRSRPSRITEKVLKPLVNFHPMIVFGNPGSLAMIREYGFATFGEIIDESYDLEHDPRRRFDRAYAEVERLCGLDDRTWRRLEGSIAETLTFNARWGLTCLPTQRRRDHDRAFVDAVRDAVRLP
jgi:hypothetical protein